jgi:hypothetical protein
MSLTRGHGCRDRDRDRDRGDRLAYRSPRTMQRKPMWLVEVSIGSAWRAAGR